MNKFIGLFVALLLAAALTGCNSAPDDGHQDDILGTWYTIGQRSTIKIYKQGDAYFGKITDLKRPLNRDGKKKRDFRNPDPDKKNNLLIGTDVLMELEYDGDKVWDDGRYYNHHRGEIKDCEVSMTKDGNLKINVEGSDKPMVWRSETYL